MDIEVTEADREATNDLAFYLENRLGKLFSQDQRAAIREAFARHRSTAHATGFAEGVERAAEAVLSLQAPHGETPFLAAWIRSYVAQAIRALKPSTDPAKEGGDE